MSSRIENGLKLNHFRLKYKRTSAKKKGLMLDELCHLYGMNRKYLIRLLNAKPNTPKKRRGPKPYYDPAEVMVPLKVIWLESDQLCGKRLKSAVPVWLPFYELDYGPLSLSVRNKLLTMSSATIDRLLKPSRISGGKKGLCGTKPGSLIKNQIPIRTNQWDEREPGFLEADTVAHCGNSLEGNFVWSLTMTDIVTTWTENRATWNKGSIGVCHQINSIEKKLPFKIKGFDCDNGSEFLNYHIMDYFLKRRKSRKVQFTRSRPYHKNDNAHVEQKNWTHVRQLFGYDRFDDMRLVKLMNDLYSKEWSLYQNHFIPGVKCILKEKINSRYRKKFDFPKTAYQRVLEHPSIPEAAKEKLREVHKTLNPFELKRIIEKKLKRIFEFVELSKKVRMRL